MKVEPKISAAFGVALLAILLLGAGAYLTTRRLLDASRVVFHSYDTLAKIADLQRSAQGADNGAQAYFLTGAPADLVPYEAGLEAIGNEIEDLRLMTADDPAQQANIDALQTETNRHVAYLHQRVEIRRTGGLEALLPRLGREGKEILDQIRFKAATLRNAELQRLKHQVELATETARRTLGIMLLLMVVGIVLLGTLHLLIGRDLGARRRAEAGLRVSEEKFRDAFERAPEAMFITDAADVIQHANARAGEMFGYEPDGLTGVPMDTLLQELPEDVVEAGGAVVPVGLVGKRKDNTLFPVETEVGGETAVGKEKLVVRVVRPKGNG